MDWLTVSPSNSYVENLWKVIRIRWDHKVGALMNGISALYESQKRACFLSALSTTWGYKEKSETRRGPNCAGILTSVFQPPELLGMHFCKPSSLRHSVMATSGLPRRHCSSLCCQSVASDSLWTPWTVAHQTLLSLGFSRQEHWRGWPCPPPGNLPDPGIKPVSLMSPALASRFFITSTTCARGKESACQCRRCRFDPWVRKIPWGRKW